MYTILEEQINLQHIEGTDSYIVPWPEEWRLGGVLYGGCVAIIIQRAATAHLRADACRFHNQKHLVNLRIDFFYPLGTWESTVTVVPVKIGAAVSTLQLKLFQDERLLAVAVATCTNFDPPLGPSVHTAWTGLAPPPEPKPHFDRVLENNAEENLAACLLKGESMSDERNDKTYVPWMSDFIRSTSDALLRNGGVCDVQVLQEKVRQCAKEHRVNCVPTDSFEEALSYVIFGNTLNIDIEYKRALPKEGLCFVLTRVVEIAPSADRFHDEILFCDENMEVVATARSSMLELLRKASLELDDKRTTPAKI